jgi:sialic acid synthase SpsE
MLVAEIGQNFCSDIQLAKEMVTTAKKCGADMVKFQLYDHAKLYKDYPEIPDSSLTFAQAQTLFLHGKFQGIEVFFSVFDTERVKWCERIKVGYYKLAYGMRNQNVVDAVMRTGKPVIASYKLDRAKVLYCVPHYPTDLSELNLASVDFKNEYHGFSDHTIGLTASKIALARGASIIEKHFAIDHQTGVDAVWSMTPDELRELADWEKTCCQTL